MSKRTDPLSFQGTVSKYMLWIEHRYPHPKFSDWLKELKPREFNGFALHGDLVIEYVGGPKSVRSKLKMELKELLKELAEKELLSDDNS